MCEPTVELEQTETNSVDRSPAYHAVAICSDSAFAVPLYDPLAGLNIGLRTVTADAFSEPTTVWKDADFVFIDGELSDCEIERVLLECAANNPNSVRILAASAARMPTLLREAWPEIYDCLGWPFDAVAFSMTMRRCIDKRESARKIAALEDKKSGGSNDSLLVADNLPAGVTYVDRQMRYTFVNKIAAKWFGMAPDRIVGRSIWEVMGQDGYESVAEPIERALHGDRQRFLQEATFPDGVTRIIDRSFVPDFDAQGRVKGFYVLANDITERSEAERLLAAGEQRLIEAIESISDGFALYDVAGRQIHWNNRYREFYPHMSDLLVPGAHLEDIARIGFQRNTVSGAAANLEEWVRIRTHTLRTGERSSYEQHLTDGRWLLCQDSRTQSGFTVAIRTDITDLKQSEERLRQATSLAKIGHWVWDAVADRCLYCSEEHARIHGETVQRNMSKMNSGEGALQFVHSDDRAEYSAAIDVLRRGGNFDHEYRIVTASGHVRHVHEVARPVFDAGGLIVRLVGTIQETTAMKMADERLRHAQKMEVVGQITGGVAHDFNNLLGIIVGNLDFLEENLRGDQALHAMAESATKAALRGAELTKQLLAFARQQPLKPKETDIGALIGAMDGLLRRTVGESVAVRLELLPGLWNTRIDAVQLQAVLLNLAVNARDAMRDGGTLTVAGGNTHLDKGTAVGAVEELPPGRYVTIEFGDTGSGMTDEVLERAIEPFFTTKDVGEGSGLGLSMAHGFARQSGGMLFIRSTVDVGTAVTLYLPAHDVPAAYGDTMDVPLQTALS